MTNAMMDEGSKGAIQWHPEGYQPLWSDNDIANDAKRASSNPTTQATIRSCLLFMRHGYEAARAKQDATIATQAAQLETERRAHLVADATLTGDLELARDRNAELTATIATLTALPKELSDSIVRRDATIATQAARIEQLERELNALAGWEPVEHLPKTPCSCGNCTNGFGAESVSLITLQSGNHRLSVVLPDDIRLCRRTGTGTQQEKRDE